MKVVFHFNLIVSLVLEISRPVHASDDAHEHKLVGRPTSAKLVERHPTEYGFDYEYEYDYSIGDYYPSGGHSPNHGTFSDGDMDYSRTYGAHYDDDLFANIPRLNTSVASSVPPNTTRVNFCCGGHQLLDMVNHTCHDSPEDLPPLDLYFPNGTASPPRAVAPAPGWPLCHVFHVAPSSGRPADFFVISISGHLLLGAQDGPLDAPPLRVAPDTYCLARPDPRTLEAYVCFPDSEGAANPLSGARDAVYRLGLAVSSGFLLLTLATFLAVPPLRDEYLGAPLMCSVAMLALCQITLVAAWSGDTAYRALTGGWCWLLVTLVQYGFLSTFFWLNIISVSVRRSITTWVRPLRLRLQCAYAFGLPLVFVGAALAREFLPALRGSVLPPPNFQDRCWFGSRTAVAVYMMGPVTVLLLVNLVCLVSSIRALSRMHVDINQPSCAKLRAKIAVSRFLPFVKLTVITGVSWLFEVVSFFTDATGSWSYLEMALDMVNMLQGPLIFALFCCRPLVWQHLRARTCLGAGRGAQRSVLECEVLRAPAVPEDPAGYKDYKNLEPGHEVNGLKNGSIP